MDKDTFGSYKFKPSDVIEGLNRYFAETKAKRYLRASLEIRRGVCYNNPDCVKDIIFTSSPYEARSRLVCDAHYLICDPEEVVGVAINWLREEHDIFYTPGMEVPVEDCDIFCMGNLKETAEDFYVDEAAKEYEKATRKDRIEELRESRRDLIEALQKRLYDAKRRIVALEEGHAEKSKIIDRQKTMIKDLEKQITEEAEENRTLRGNLDYFANLAQGRQIALSNLRYEILKVYREIFDCSNGDPEGSDEETIQDILTEYKRCLELKNVAEEKTIKYKEQAKKYVDVAKENRLQWAQKENLEWLKRYEALKSERNEMKTLYCGAAVGNGGLCEDLAKEREKVKRMEQKLAEIQDICER